MGDVDPSQFDQKQGQPSSGGRTVTPDMFDQSAPKKSGDWFTDFTNELNADSAAIVDPIKPFTNSVGRAGAGILGMLADYNPASAPMTIAKQITGETTGGQQISQMGQDYFGPPDPDHPYQTAFGEMLASAAIPIGGTLPRILSALGAGTGLGIARENKAGPMVEMGASLAGGLAPAAVGGILSGMKGAGQAMMRKSIGARQSDYMKTAEDLGIWDLADDGVQTQTKQVIDELQASGALGNTAKAPKLLATAIENQTALSKQAGGLIDAYDAAGGAPVAPTFKRALDYISSGKVKANEADRYLEELSDVAKGISNEGQGKLRYLQNQKVTWGGQFEVGNSSRNGFNQAVYRDLKDAIEGAVPDIKGINAQIAKYKIVRPILDRNLSADEASSMIGKVLQMIRTSGGTLTTPILMGGAIGGAAGGPVGAAIGAGLTAAATPAGQRLVGKTLTGAAALGSSIGGMEAAIPAAIGVGSAIINEQGTAPKFDFSGSQFGPAEASAAVPEASTPEETMPLTDQPVNLPKILNAIKHVESRGKTDATSSVGAKGQYQLMDATGREWHKKLGIKEAYNPRDPAQSRKIAGAYVKFLIDYYDGDVTKAVTAYHTGIGNVDKNKIGPRGKEYAGLVEKAYDKL